MGVGGVWEGRDREGSPRPQGPWWRLSWEGTGLHPGARWQGGPPAKQRQCCLLCGDWCQAWGGPPHGRCCQRGCGPGRRTPGAARVMSVGPGDQPLSPQHGKWRPEKGGRMKVATNCKWSCLLQQTSHGLAWAEDTGRLIGADAGG